MRKITLFAFLVFAGVQLFAQEDAQSDTVGAYIFSNIKTVPHTAVKDQHRSGTCWSYAGVSFVEAELMRLNGTEVDLSEMWPVRYAYEKKADSYMRFHGNYNFGPGGEPHQVMKVLAEHGMVPEEAYDGLTSGEDLPVHGEMDHVLKSFVGAVSENKNRKLSPVWIEAYNGVLDAYLGKKPAEFDYDGKSYTPGSFTSEVVNINPEEYVEVTSFTHHDYYRNFLLMIPDNWDYEMYYNVPMVDLTNILDLALSQGYTVAWTADVSDKGFKHKKGLALVPEKKWSDMRSGERDSVFIVPMKQREITAEMRQESYDNYTTNDDHIMHIVGMAEDLDGNTWYKVKNSWAGDSNEFGGYFYASQAYINYKTIALYVNRDVLPQGLD